MLGRQLVVAMAAVASWWASLLASTAAAAPRPERGRARPSWREHGRAPTDYALVYQHEARVPRTGEAVWVGKCVDRVTGRIEIVYRDRRA